ncbi:MAG: GTP cyclohydrolase II [Oligoflexia bacterium]|nr:GTP cyclohydrolase II [Oligoflexia bacterium]
MQAVKTDSFEAVLDDYTKGRAVIILDDADRENEGDIAVAAEFISADLVAFMMREARGLICVSISPSRAAFLNLPLQTSNNQSPFHTAFAVSVDHVSVADCGASAEARARTIRALVDPGAKAEDFVSPGHVFPLIANPTGVLGRQGQTEGSFDLARMAGCLEPGGVICEILNADGSMARGAELTEYASLHGLKLITIADIIARRIQHEVLLRNVAEGQLDTAVGACRTYVFQDDVAGKEHLAVVFGDLSKAGAAGPLVRVHSECLTGDVFGSRRCDCGPQLYSAMRMMKQAGAGVVLYLRQEGRGIGLTNKLRAYALQDQGHDTVEANIKLGFPADMRDFVVAGKMLTALGVNNVRLLTNNPDKLQTLERFGIVITERIPMVIEADEYSKDYLSTKRDKLGHWL